MDEESREIKLFLPELTQGWSLFIGSEIHMNRNRDLSLTGFTLSNLPGFGQWVGKG